jgi:mRNA interferase RelE/StbE
MAAVPYDIDYADEAVNDITSFRFFDQKKLFEAIAIHLKHEPTRISRSRIKQMVQPFWSQYRLRVEDFRVYYDVDEDKRAVHVLRVLEKGREVTQEGGSDEAD